MKTLSRSLIALSFLWLPSVASATYWIVRNGESIQDAVDAAYPGDTIFVRRGTYTGTPGEEYVVEVDKDDITLIGHPRAVIDATGFEYGVMVGEDAEIGAAGCPPITIHGFKIRGFTIKNATDTGVRIVGTEDYAMTHGRYLNNEEYGPFPICSVNGRINHNYVRGCNDAGVYVGDDINTTVKHNVVTDCVVGIEIENSRNSEVAYNMLYGNAGGALIFVGPNLPQPFNEDVRFHHNFLYKNNRQNTGGGAVAGVPEGSGLLIFGSDRVTVDHNWIGGNDSFGIAVIGNPNAFLDPRIDPFNDDVVVKKNKIRGNGKNPDPLRQAFPGADIIFVPDVFDPETGTLLLADPDPSDNCFAKNRFRTDFPPGIVDMLPCN